MRSRLKESAVSVQEAWDRWMHECDFQGSWRTVDFEEVPINNALGRVVAKPVLAHTTLPNHYAAAYDGILIRAQETFSATPDNPYVARLDENSRLVQAGGIVPEEFDAVVPYYYWQLGDSETEAYLNEPIDPWTGVRPRGDDVVEGEVLLAAGRKIDSIILGALVASAVEHLTVVKQPKVALIVCGENLVDAGITPKPGQLVEGNRPVLREQLLNAGAIVEEFPIIDETFSAIESAVQEAKESCQAIVLCSGPSFGCRFLADCLDSIGDVLVSQIAMRPAGNIILGMAGSVPVLGLPFQLVDAYIGYRVFGYPLVRRFAGILGKKQTMTRGAILGEDLNSIPETEEYIRVHLGEVCRRTVAVPQNNRSSNLLALTKADGLIHVPAGVTKWTAGTPVRVEALDHFEDYSRNLLLAGTTDQVLNLVKQVFGSRYPGGRFCLSKIGGTRGLEALKRGYCHIVTAHLFDEATGTYNIEPAKHVLGTIPFIVVHLAKRNLGLAVQAGNPKGIKGLESLADKTIKVAYRNEGSGTRKVLDHFMKEKGLVLPQEDNIPLLHNHMAIAGAVASGLADTGPTIYTAALSLGLDFIPALWENLDMIIPTAFLGLDSVHNILSLLSEPSFIATLQERFTHYNFSETGQVLFDSRNS